MNYKEFQEKQEELLSQITRAPCDWLSIDPHGRMIWEGEGFAITPEMALRIADWIYKVYGDPKEIEQPVADVSGKVDPKFMLGDVVAHKSHKFPGQIIAWDINNESPHYLYHVSFERDVYFYDEKSLTLIADIDEKNGASR